MVHICHPATDKYQLFSLLISTLINMIFIQFDSIFEELQNCIKTQIVKMLIDVTLYRIQHPNQSMLCMFIGSLYRCWVSKVSILIRIHASFYAIQQPFSRTTKWYKNIQKKKWVGPKFSRRTSQQPLFYDFLVLFQLVFDQKTHYFI